MMDSPVDLGSKNSSTAAKEMEDIYMGLCIIKKYINQEFLGVKKRLQDLQRS
jgi:hypothetical protein